MRLTAVRRRQWRNAAAARSDYEIRPQLAARARHPKRAGFRCARVKPRLLSSWKLLQRCARGAKLSQLPEPNFSVRRPQRSARAASTARVCCASRAATRACSSCLELLASVRLAALRLQDTYPITPADAAQRPVAPLFAGGSGMTKSEATNRGAPNAGSAKLLTASALSDNAFVQRTALHEERLLAQTIGVWSNSELQLGERRKTPSARAPLRSQDARLRPHRGRIAADLA